MLMCDLTVSSTEPVDAGGGGVWWRWRGAPLWQREGRPVCKPPGTPVSTTNCSFGRSKWFRCGEPVDKRNTEIEMQSRREIADGRLRDNLRM